MPPFFYSGGWFIFSSLFFPALFIMEKIKRIIAEEQKIINRDLNTLPITSSKSTISQMPKSAIIVKSKTSPINKYETIFFVTIA